MFFSLWFLSSLFFVIFLDFCCYSHKPLIAECHWHKNVVPIGNCCTRVPYRVCVCVTIKLVALSLFRLRSEGGRCWFLRRASHRCHRHSVPCPLWWEAPRLCRHGDPSARWELHGQGGGGDWQFNMSDVTMTITVGKNGTPRELGYSETYPLISSSPTVTLLYL